MSGIYIPGMGFPGGEQLVIITPDGMAMMVGPKVTKLRETQAIPVPAHGRTIDADEYQAKMRNAYDDDWFTVLEAVPTVIPADPADKEEKT